MDNWVWAKCKGTFNSTRTKKDNVYHIKPTNTNNDCAVVIKKTYDGRTLYCIQPINNYNILDKDEQDFMDLIYE